MKKIVMMLLPVMLAGVLLAGCGGGVSEDKPIADVMSEAKAMTAPQIEGMVANYKKAIESKKAELVKLQEKIKTIPVTELMGDEAKKLKSDLSAVGTSVRALTDRLNVYVRELRAKM